MRVISSMIDGVIAVFALTAWYVAVMRVFTGSWQVGTQQLSNLWPYMTFLVISFGTYVGTSSFAKQKSPHSVATGVSTGTMVLCCLHHVSDLAILVSASSLISILGFYQPVLLFVSGLVNTLLTVNVIRMMRKNA